MSRTPRSAVEEKNLSETDVPRSYAFALEGKIINELIEEKSKVCLSALKIEVARCHLASNVT